MRASTRARWSSGAGREEAGEISPPAPQAPQEADPAEAGAREVAQAQRPPRGPAGQPQAGPGDPGKSIGALARLLAESADTETEQQP